MGPTICLHAEEDGAFRITIDADNLFVQMGVCRLEIGFYLAVPIGTQPATGRCSSDRDACNAFRMMH